MTGREAGRGDRPRVSDSMIESLTELRASLTGDVIAPSDREYERARLCFNLLIDRRPAVIARCVDAGDVATALAFAQEHDLEIAVRGGGHNPAGHCAVDDGLVIDLSRMRNVVVDPEARIAVSGGGATWTDFDAATQAHGLVTPGGVVGSTGVAGLTLGGGIGHLTAQHGLTCDNLIAAELVTPAGEVVRANGDETPELLWGIRGGGGNFGVATRIKFRLHPLERVIGGRFEYAGDGVRDALRAFRDVDAGAGKDLSCQAQLTVDEALTRPSRSPPATRALTRIRVNTARYARRPGSSTTGSAPRASSTSSGCSTPATALTGTTGRAISCASCRTSFLRHCSNAWPPWVARPAQF